MKKTDYSGKHISSHEIWERSLQDEKLDKKGGAHAKEYSKADYKADERARKAHNKAVAAKKGGISQKIGKEFVAADKKKRK